MISKVVGYLSYGFSWFKK